LPFKDAIFDAVTCHALGLGVTVLEAPLVVRRSSRSGLGRVLTIQIGISMTASRAAVAVLAIVE
jgi:hypothetical protein